MKLKIKFANELAKQIYARREKPLAWNYGDSGLDVSYCGDAPQTIPAGGIAKFGTGLCCQLSGAPDDNFEIQVRGRSGLKVRGQLVPMGTIDFTYTGESHIIIYNASKEDFIVHPGDRIAQFVIAPIIKPEIEFTDELQETARGAKGFGSSGI
ncbi:MAG: dUTP diphosphatase [Rickettsiales bacterium]|nr:dUTP diphosphatase [Rickettsiales bacterium]